MFHKITEKSIFNLSEYADFLYESDATEIIVEIVGYSTITVESVNGLVYLPAIICKTKEGNIFALPIDRFNIIPVK